MNQRPQAVPKRRLLGLSLAALLALAALTMLALPALPKADSGTPTVAKKKKQKKITGTLTQGGYTVIALAKDGEAKTDRAPKGAFKLRPPAKKVTLHLRASDGTYAGPIVVGTRKQGKRAIEGVYAGAKLGKVKVKAGYAKLKLRKKWVDKKREARAKKGVPIGAGNFGRVKSKKTKGGAPGDLDLDGIADPLDIDDDGDKVLDNLDRKPRKGSASLAAIASGDFGLKTTLFGPLFGTVNANAGLTAAQIEPALPMNGIIWIDVLPGDLTELDCGTNPGLPYCSSGGTGRLPDGGFGNEANWRPFPDCCDPDGDGFGTLTPDQKTDPGNPALTVLHPGATSDQIGSGDVLIERVTTGGVETQFVATLQYVFATNPALVSYDDGQGNSTTLSYPVPFEAPGNRDDPFLVKAGPSGDVVLDLTFWRPQRRPIPPETGEWIDIGGLQYGVSLAGEDTGKFTCPQPAYSTEDPDLTPIEGVFQGTNDPPNGGFQDLTRDRPASPANTFTLQLNLTKCLESRGGSFDPGEERGFTFSAFAPQQYDPPNNPDDTNTTVFFKR